MEYTIYTQNFCPSCDILKVSLEDKGVSLEYVNIDEIPYRKPLDLFITPALYKGDCLIAYGMDILKKFDE